MEKKKSNKLSILLLVIVAFIVIFFSLKDNLDSAIDYLLNMNYSWILLSVILVLLYIFFQSLSQYRFLKEVKKDYKLSSCLKLMTIAMFFNAITPFSSGGQPFEMYLLNKEGIKVSDSANALLQNFITFQFSLIFMGFISIVFNKFLCIIPNDLVLKKIVILGFVINVSVMLIIILFSRGKSLNTKIFNKIFNFIFSFKFIKNREQKRKKAEKTLDDFYNSTAIMKNNLKNTILSIIFNTLALVCLYMVPFFVFKAFGSEIRIIDSIVLSAYTFLIGAFVPIPGATGGLEYGFMTFFGVYAEGGLLSSAMLVWRLLTYYLGMIIGGITLVTYRRKE